jgi:hypothetical protein
MARMIVRDPEGERSIDLKDGITTFGRAPENGVVVRDKEFSRRHFQIEKIDGGFKLVDLESRNGSRVNGRTVNQHLLRPGDKIEIGKTTIVFEDPNFREPSAALAASFAPPPVTAATAPVAATPPKPATSPIPRAGAERRTGHTTAVERRRDLAFQRDEKKTLQLVGWIGGSVVGIMVVLIVVGSVTRENPEIKAAQDAISRAQKLESSKPQEAIAIYESVGPGAGEKLHRQAKDRIAALKAQHGSVVEKKVEPAEQRMFDPIYDLQQNSPHKVEEIIRRCEEYKTTYPNGAYIRNVEEYLKRARDDRSAARRREVDDLSKDVDDSLKQADFRKSLMMVEKVYDKYKGDIDLRQAIEKIQVRVVEAGRKHATEQIAAADAKAKEGAREDARKILALLIDQLGTSSEFENQVQLAKVKYDALK